MLRVCQALKMASQIRKYLFNLYLEQPSYRALLDTANLTKQGDDGQYLFRGIAVHLMANKR